MKEGGRRRSTWWNKKVRIRRRAGLGVVVGLMVIW